MVNEPNEPNKPNERENGIPELKESERPLSLEVKEEKQPDARGKGSWAWGAGALVLLSKLKTLLLALLKFGKPLLSMAVTVGAYALIYPWTFALGFVALILVHEMGHVWAAKRRGLPVSAPLFIPFLGALILLKRHPKDAETEASVAIGGPMLGTVGALVCFLIGQWSGYEIWYALAYVGFFINLFNLIPVNPMDGGKIITAVSRWLWVAGAVIGPFAIWMTQSILFALIWIWFLWQMYRQFFGKKKAQPVVVEGVYIAEADPNLPDWYFSGQTHRRELPFTAYCRMDGQHVAEFWWEPLSFKGELEINTPCTINSVSIVQAGHPDEENKVKFKVRLEGEAYQADNYYEVPTSVRWRFGLMYGGLAAFLGYMMWVVHEIGLTNPR